jgi:chromosome segregation ATPase
MKRAAIGFLLGVILTGGLACWWILDQRSTIDRLRADLESADRELVRSQVRIVRVTETIERVRVEIRTVRERIDTSLGRVDEIQGGLEDGLGILRTVRSQRLD